MKSPEALAITGFRDTPNFSEYSGFLIYKRLVAATMRYKREIAACSGHDALSSIFLISLIAVSWLCFGKSSLVATS